MRTTPAYYQSADGTSFIFVSGAQKLAACGRTPVPPGLVRLKLITTSQTQAASLKIDAKDSTLSFLNPGPPSISSNAGKSPIVWVLDANVFRSERLVSDNVSPPVLYAVDGSTMQLLWHSAPDE